MKWTLRSVDQETAHRFLNFYTLHYEVEKDGVANAYPYFIASRREKERLLPLLRDYSLCDGVLILAMREAKEKEVLLIRQFRPAWNATIVEFPAGLLDGPDEEVVDAAKREASEETGVTLEDIHLLCPPSPTSSGLSDENVAIVEGRVAALGQDHLERFEDIHAEFVPLSQIPALLEDKTQIIALNVRLALLYVLKREGIR